MSPLTRKKRQEQKRILNNASTLSADLNVEMVDDDKNLTSLEAARGITLSDLGTLLQDLEVIELENIITEKEKKKQ